MKTYQVGSVTDRGHLRPGNQDCALICTGRRGGRPLALLAVADGMGGLAQGEKASGLAVRALAAWWNQGGGPASGLDEASRLLDREIYAIHRQIYEMSCQAGTTLSVLFLDGEHYLYKQIGDSRIYLYEGRGTRQLTEDQTWCNDRLKEGLLSREEARLHPMRHALSNALGVSEELKIATGQGPLRRGSAFLLCSDGFYNSILDQVEQGGWGRSRWPQRQLDRMMQQVLEGTAEDNATAVLCRVPWLL